MSGADGAPDLAATVHAPPSTAGITLETAARAAEADLPTGNDKTVLVRSMFDAIAPRYDMVNRTMTFGLDTRWPPDRSGAPLAQADGADLPVASGAVDGVTCGYALRNFTELATVLHELARIVRPGGRISLLEVAEPESGLLRAGHRIWFHRVVPVIGGLLSDRSAYRYLPKSTAYLPPTDELRSMLTEAGFSAVNRRGLSGGLSQIVTATRSGRA